MPDPAGEPVISVVVVNWNRRELLRACLASLARQRHRSFEVVVVDNGSQDASGEMVLELARSYPVPLRLIANSSNLGFCEANNQGIAASGAELVALLNNDAEAEPGWLEALESAIRLHEDVGMAASKILVWQGPGDSQPARTAPARHPNPPESADDVGEPALSSSSVVRENLPEARTGPARHPNPPESADDAREPALSSSSVVRANLPEARTGPARHPHPAESADDAREPALSSSSVVRANLPEARTGPARHPNPPESADDAREPALSSSSVVRANLPEARTGPARHPHPAESADDAREPALSSSSVVRANLPEARTGPARHPNPPESADDAREPALSSSSVVRANLPEARTGPARHPNPAESADDAREPGSVVRANYIDKCGHLIYPDGQNRGRGAGQLDHGQFDRVEEVLWPDGCAAMYRRAMLEDVGGFDEEFFAYADDAELGLRGRIAGWRCFYAPGAVVRHHRGATLGIGSARRLTLIERNRVLLVVKLFPWNLVWANAGYHFARIAAGIWAALRNKGEHRYYPGAQGTMAVAAALIRGKWSALPLIPSMLRKRKAFRSKHRLTPRQVRSLLLHYRIPLKELSEQAA